MDNKTRQIKVKDLLLDVDNPRLPSTVSKEPNDILTYIARTTSITEIMSAIAQNGYFPGEPLVVIPSDKENDKFIVVEGNRRLTALKLLLDPSLYPKNKTIREVSENAKYCPDEVPAVVFTAREDVINYLGYRHITGVKQWEPLSKARYIYSYFKDFTDTSLAPLDRYRQVAKAIGSRSNYIKRQLDGLAVYNVIEEHDFFNIDGLNEEDISFSLLDTSLGYEAVHNFVASGADLTTEPEKINVENVSHLASWLFLQNKNGETRLGDSRNIKKLAMVVAEPLALEKFIEGDTLDKAYSYTKGVSVDFTEVLAEAENAIDRAVSMVALVNLDDGHITRIGNIFKQSRLLRNQAESSNND